MILIPAMSFANPLSAPSVGRIVKKILEVNPDLGTQEIIAIVRRSMRRAEVPGEAGGLAPETVDEAAALALARASLPKNAIL